MRTHWLIFSSILAVFFCMPASGQNSNAQDDYHALTQKEYKALLGGKTIKGEYRFARKRTQTFLFEERHNQDGTTDYKEGPLRSKGLWFTLGTHKICYKYPNDKDILGTSCFWVYLSKGCYYGYSLSEMSLMGPRDFDDWSARWIVKGDGGSCNIPMS